MTKARPSIKRLLTGFLSLIVIVLLVRYTIDIWADLKELQIVNLAAVWLLIGYSFINLFAFGRGMDAVLSPFGVNLSIRETLKISAITRLINQIAPGRLGLAARANYLKSKYGLNYTNYASSFVASNIVMYVFNSLFGLLALYFIPKSEAINLFGLILLGVLVGLIGLVAIKPSTSRLSTQKRLTRLLKNAIEGWYQIRSHPPALRGTALWTVVNLVTQVLIFMASFNVLGVDVGFWEVTFISSVTLLSVFIGITPGALGVTEGLAVAASVALGIGGAPALAAAVLRRLSGFLVSTLTSLANYKTLKDWLHTKDNHDSQAESTSV